jgi:hypothetical protein
MSKALTLSDHIDRLVDFLRTQGITLHLYAFELPCCGMYRSETREIWVNDPDAKSALMTLAHEGGHWAGYLVKPKEHSYQRERQAFVYGWKILCLMGSAQVISRADWIAEEHKRRAAPDVDTSHIQSLL